MDSEASDGQSCEIHLHCVGTRQGGGGRDGENPLAATNLTD